MNQQNFDSLVNGLTRIQKDIFNILPERDMFSVTQVAHKMKETGCLQPVVTIRNCLYGMCSSGLVSEYKKDCFKRVVPTKRNKVTLKRPKKMAATKPVNNPVTIVPEEPAINTPEHLLAGISADMRRLLDNVAYAEQQLTEYFKTTEAKLKKMKQLQDLLKGLND